MSGTAFVKWRLPSSSAPEHHGHTDKAIIIDHRAYWNYEKVLQVRLTIDRNQTLHECELYFEIIQEFASGGNNEKNLLGRIRLNLSEYVDKSDDDEGIVRRYLMQDSKINSTLKVGIATRQVEGDRNYITYVIYYAGRRFTPFEEHIADDIQAASQISHGLWRNRWGCIL